MGSRERILNAIKKLAQPVVEISSPIADQETKTGLLSAITEKLLSIGADVLVFKERSELKKYLHIKYTENEVLVNAIPNLPNYNVEECLHWQPIEISSVKKFVVKGDIGVAESGAIWVSEESMKVRLLPFVCEQLYIVLYENDLVFDLEEAYERIGILKDGYGVFIAGPSKTADIEQSLVIGAHGPIGLTVLFIKKEIELL